MEYLLEKQQFCTSSILLNTVIQQLVDADITLADYCPDIQKIIKCTITPRIFGRNVAGDQLTVDGNTIVKVLYCDSIKGNLRCCEQSVPFSVTIPLKKHSDNYVIDLHTKAEYINCRALSSRRLIIHSSFSLYVKVVSKDDTQLLMPCGENCSDLQFKTDKKELMKLIAFCQEEIPIVESISLTGKPQIESILRSNVRINSYECKAIKSKLLLSGEIEIKLFYLADIDSGKTENIEYVIPFSNIIDCDGVDDNIENFTKLNILSFDIRTKSDSDGEAPSIDIDIKLSFIEYGYVKTEYELISDTYSTENQINASGFTFTSCADMKKITDLIMSKNTILSESEPFTEIMDIFSEFCTVIPSVTEQNLVLNGKYNICIFALGSEGNKFYTERSFEFEYKIPVSEEFNTVSDCNCEVSAISFRISSDNEIEIRAEIKLNAILDSSITVSTISSIEQGNALTGINDYSVVIHYTQENESVWDIAKKYHSPFNTILTENSIEKDILSQQTALFVPLM